MNEYEYYEEAIKFQKAFKKFEKNILSEYSQQDRDKLLKQFEQIENTDATYE